MAQATFHFPRGFLWGTATAAHQVEGGNTNNNWWAWEQQPGKIIHGHTSGLACDWWGGRWREDFDRAAEAGQNAHRMSIEWSRIQPAPDRWDEAALDRYREMVRGLMQRKMLPLVTLHHFSDPIWFTEMGGWENEKSAELFEAFTRRAVEALKEYVSMWVTINEPNVLLVNGYTLGEFPPGKKDMRLAFAVAENFVKSHARSYHAIHQLQPQARVGIALNYRGFVPSRAWLPLDRTAAGLQSRIYNDLFPQAITSGVLKLPLGSRRIKGAENTHDYLGLNYYTQDQVRFSLAKAGELFGSRFYNPEAELSETGFIANEPEGIYQALQWGRQFKRPIIITENGVEGSQDNLRPRYILEHLHQVWRAVNQNLPVKGYFYWTLVDNFEWERGWTQRFGLWELDVETQARSKRPSADLYREIAQENGISSDMVARYAPELLEKMFPD
jgi:beta-glucosidase